jgi:leucyl aminopeptidase
MRKVSLLQGLLILIFSLATSAFAKPVEVIELEGTNKTDQPLVALTPQKILYAEGSSILVRTSEAKTEDFQDLYVVLTPNWFTFPESFSIFGKLVDFAPTKFAVMRLTPAKAEEISGQLHHAGMACGVLLKLNGEPMVTQLAATPVPVIPVTIRDARVQEMVSLISADNIRTTIEQLSEIYTRFHTSATGRGVADMLADKYEQLKGDRTDVTISTYDHGSATPQNSLVVRIEGQTIPSEVIVLGSHIDSVNWNNGSSSRAPGADDNASGTATNMEIFRVMMEQGIRLERTLEIHGYSAEEIGLVGSQDMVTDYRNAGVNVVAMVQHDMTLWKASGAEDKIFFVTSNTDSGFNDLLGSLVTSYVGVPFAKMALSGGSSDHASWRRAGYATAFPFENPSSYNRNIHTANDTIERSGAFNQAAAFAKLGLSYIAHFGGIN